MNVSLCLVQKILNFLYFFLTETETIKKKNTAKNSERHFSQRFYWKSDFQHLSSGSK